MIIIFSFPYVTVFPRRPKKFLFLQQFSNYIKTYLGLGSFGSIISDTQYVLSICILNLFFLFFNAGTSPQINTFYNLFCLLLSFSSLGILVTHISELIYLSSVHITFSQILLSLFIYFSFSKFS